VTPASSPRRTAPRGARATSSATAERISFGAEADVRGDVCEHVHVADVAGVLPERLEERDVEVEPLVGVPSFT